MKTNPSGASHTALQTTGGSQKNARSRGQGLKT